MTLLFDHTTKTLFDTTFFRLFNQENINWDSRAVYNETFLKVQESYFNDRLAAKGYLFLNDVYDALGFPRVPAGQLIGWVHAEGQTVEMRLTPNDDGSVMIMFNISNNDTMYHKI